MSVSLEPTLTTLPDTQSQYLAYKGPRHATIETDVVIVGAGPAGIFQAFQLGLHGIQAHIVDTLHHPGGQCLELYADKNIYDIPGIPACSGKQLIAQLLQQAAPFKSIYHLNQEVVEIVANSDQTFQLRTSRELLFKSKAVVIAAGVGAFLPRPLKLPAVDQLATQQLFYSRYDLPPVNPNEQPKNLVIVGGHETAIEAALYFSSTQAPYAWKSITLVYRRKNSLQASPEALHLFNERCAQGQLQFIAGQIGALEQDIDTHQLKAVEISVTDGTTFKLPCDILLSLSGTIPKLNSITAWGLAMENKQIRVDTQCFATSTPGIYAIGDINTYPGKQRLILCSFHEATLAAYGIAKQLFPHQHIQLQYTTSNQHLQRILGNAL